MNKLNQGTQVSMQAYPKVVTDITFSVWLLSAQSFSPEIVDVLPEFNQLCLEGARIHSFTSKEFNLEDYSFLVAPPFS